MVLKALIGHIWRCGLDGHGLPQLFFGELEAELCV